MLLLRELVAAINRNTDAQLRVSNRLGKLMSPLDNLTAAVQADTNAESAAATLIQTLASQIKQSANDPAAVQALADQINANASALAAAVTANTPASIPNTPAAGTVTTSPASGTPVSSSAGAQPVTGVQQGTEPAAVAPSALTADPGTPATPAMPAADAPKTV